MIDGQPHCNHFQKARQCTASITAKLIKLTAVILENRNEKLLVEIPDNIVAAIRVMQGQRPSNCVINEI